MSFIKTTVLTFAVLALCLGPSPLAATQKEEEKEETLSLPLDESNALPMTTLLAFAGKTLGISILYSPDEIEDCAYHFTEKVEVPRSAFQGFFERLLLDKGFLLVESREGSVLMYKVLNMRNRGAAGQTGAACTARFVPPEDLEKYSARGILISTIIPLKNIQARDMISSLTTLFQQGGLSVESVRPVENANALVITTFGYKAWRIAALTGEMDQIAAEKAPILLLRREEARLANRVAALEKKVAALEGKSTEEGK